jgi:hypothetical protein
VKLFCPKPLRGFEVGTCDLTKRELEQLKYYHPSVAHSAYCDDFIPQYVYDYEEHKDDVAFWLANPKKCRDFVMHAILDPFKEPEEGPVISSAALPFDHTLEQVGNKYRILKPTPVWFDTLQEAVCWHFIYGVLRLNEPM